MTTLLLTVLIIFVYTILFVCVGHGAKQSLLKKSNIDIHPTLHLAISFFIGTAVFLSFWVVVGHLLGNVRTGLGLATAAAVAIAGSVFFNSNGPDYPRRTLLIATIVSLLCMSMCTMKALVPMPGYFVTEPELVNSFLGFGNVAHSFRAANVTEFITTENTFPIIGQHTGQSIIASIPSILSIHAPQLSLTLWMGIFISFLVILTYGLARLFITNRYYALIPVLIVTLGNTVLSPFYSSITDTESALLLSSNIDSIFSITTFLILCFLIYFSSTTTLLPILALTFLTGLIWNITGGQMIILFITVILGTLLLQRYKTGTFSSRLRNILITFCISSAIGASFLGGMLNPSTKSDAVGSIPGTMSLKQENTPAVALRFPRTVESGSHTLDNIKKMIADSPETNQADGSITETVTDQGDLSQSVKRNELVFKIAMLVRSFQIVFFPLVGLFGLYFMLRRKIITSTLAEHLLQYAVLLFTVGWIASTFFKLYGYYWELSKFFYIGVYVSMFCLGLGMALWLQCSQRYRVVLIATLIFVTTGPVIELFGVRILGNLYLPPDSHPNFQATIDGLDMTPLSMKERFDFLLESNSTYGEKIN